jgi:hypothetical protein
MRKTALLTSVAGFLLMTAPAFAQDTAPQTPPPASPPAAEASPSLTLNPGQTVRGSDGAELGKLVGARNTPAGQELVVRGSDGQLRGVPTAGIAQQGSDITVSVSSGQFQSSPAIADGAPPASEGPPPAEPTEPAEEPAEPATPPAEPTAPPPTPN